MDRKVKWTEAAWTDLEEVSDYIARDSEYYAASFVREVRDAARAIGGTQDRQSRPSIPLKTVLRTMQRTQRLEIIPIRRVYENLNLELRNS